MDYNTYSERLSYILEMIKKGQLESPSQLIEQFNCTEKTIRNMINSLRKSGYEIEYSRVEMRYYLKDNTKRK
ncbi:HTH domain-containing protein [Ekhidna sp.]|jgi:DeoR/GlpR family transcriptional regulator of sugar metabolism|uniref:HTH domain-containing protein n=1 Tax=Ekhidna sp. TaxID=2608089 RepID=UPI0032EB6D36